VPGVAIATPKARQSLAMRQLSTCDHEPRRRPVKNHVWWLPDHVLFSMTPVFGAASDGRSWCHGFTWIHDVHHLGLGSPWRESRIGMTQTLTECPDPLPLVGQAVLFDYFVDFVRSDGHICPRLMGATRRVAPERLRFVCQDQQ
jgi:hypothetical protein